MLKRIFITKAKSKAQGLLEFALVIPILLMVIYGVLETGRLLFIFASVHTASREAVRYGSAIGLVDTDNNDEIDTPRYEDCSGITAAANKVSFIGSFSNINITYDRGLDSSGDVIPITGINPDPSDASTCTSLPEDTIQNGDRINVHVAAQFAPIISIIPLDPITIESAASRTILGEITIFVTAVAGGWSGTIGTGELSLDTELDTGYSTVFDEPGDIVHFIYTLTNIDPDEDALNGAFQVKEFYLPGVTVNTDCSGATSPLAWPDSTTCTGTYTVTQADIDAGTITSLTVASTIFGIVSNEDYLDITLVQDYDLGLEKSGTPAVAVDVGETITYTYTLNNNGNTTLTGPFSIDDNKIASVDCSSATDPLPPGASTTCTATYVITADDIDDNSVTNEADATSNEDVSDTISFTVITNTLLFDVSANPTTATSVGEIITWTYRFTNVGPENLQSPYEVSATYLGTLNFSCSTAPIPPGGFMECSSQYEITQADFDAGFITTVATATAKLNSVVISSNEASETVFMAQNAVLELTSITTIPVSPVTVEGTVITYTYTLQNNGDVSLASLSIDDDLYGSIACTGATDPLPPGASTTCNPASPVTHVVSATDLADGSIINEASATATIGTTGIPTTSSDALATIITYPAARMTFELTVDKVAASPGEIVTYTYKMRNTGDTIFSGFTLTEIVNPGVTFNPACISAPIAIGEDVSCSAIYTITDADATAGSVSASWEASAPEASLASSSTVTLEAFICNVSISNIVALNNTFYATITSNASLVVSSITVTWNHDNGHITGPDKTTLLTQVSVDPPNSSIAVDPSDDGIGPTYFTPVTYTPTIPENVSNVVFTFHQDYQNPEGTDQINITFSNPTCQLLGATP